jgi:hypothetical protein
MEWWQDLKWFLIIFGIYKITMWFLSDGQKKCAWCDGSKINFVTGSEGEWFWEYRNKDGSKDKRVKNNFQQARYESNFECEECSAITRFIHFAHTEPNTNVKVRIRGLLIKGNNDRKGTDWASDTTIPFNINQENRKNK